MEIYDYTNNYNEIDKLSEILDNLKRAEVVAALNAINETQKSRFAQVQSNYRNWFDAAILPLLKDFAEMTSSILEIDAQSETYIIATIKNEYRIDITESCRAIRSLLILAEHISIDLEDGMILLSLDYKCPNMIE